MPMCTHGPGFALSNQRLSVAILCAVSGLTRPIRWPAAAGVGAHIR